MPQNKTIPITLIEGDGIGPEITESTIEILDVLKAPFQWSRFKAGLAALEESGDVLPEPMLNNIRQTKLALKAPLTTPVGEGFRSATVRLREKFNLYANIRPARTFVSGGRFEDIDMVLIRENTEGLYVGVEHYIPVDGDDRAVALALGIMTRAGCKRIAEFTYNYALQHNRKKITIVHKANILKKLTGLFLDTALDTGKQYEKQLEIEDRIVDNTAMQLVINPLQFDIILTSNMFGDILSDEIAGLVSGLGLAPGGNIGNDTAIFEAIHGTAPDIAGQGIANPTAMLLAASMLLEHTNEHDKAKKLNQAIKNVLNEDNIRTHDLGGNASTSQYTHAIIKRLADK